MCTVLYCTVLYCTVLYCTLLYFTVLYCTVLYSTVPVNTLLTIPNSTAAGKLLNKCASSYFARKTLLNGSIIVI